MKKFAWLFILSAFCYSNLLIAQKNVPDIFERAAFPIGESITFYSKKLKENRTVNIYLPLNYSDDAKKSYPVIYLLDGSADEDFIHISGLVQFGSFPWVNLIRETIVVGIANTNRKKDFTFPSKSVRDKLEYPMAGDSKDFIAFLEKELQPFINRHYRVTTDKTIIGQSLGGLLATEILFKKPDMFDNYIIVSPSLWWDDESLLATKPSHFEDKKAIYIAVGKEGPVMEGLSVRLKNILDKSVNSHSSVYFKMLREQNHGDALHLAVYDAFRTIFAQKN